MRGKKHNDVKGEILSLFSGVAKVGGLNQVSLFEMLVDEEGKPAGLTIGFDEFSCEVLLFDEHISSECKLYRSFKQFSIPVSQEHIGRVIDGLGRPNDQFGPVSGDKKIVFAQAPGIIERERVRMPLSTGIKIIDASLPLGRGQRELIIGDRKLGKSTLATDIVLNQKYANPKVVCVYVLCGQKEDKLLDLVNILSAYNAFAYSVVVTTSAFSSFAQVFLAPFVGCTISEFFRDAGKDVLLVYDDLSQHAKAYRDIALLLERPPGRETYPGDIFSLHALLLERAGKLSEKNGGGSITALPIIETQEGDITGFIPTNLISITDGQIYMERGLYEKGFLPAINIGLSVSRIGSHAQPSALHEVTGGLRLTLAQHKQLQKLLALETTTNKESEEKIHQGDLLLEFLKQEKHTYLSWQDQAILFFAINQGLFDSVKNESLKNTIAIFLRWVQYKHRTLGERLEKNQWTDVISRDVKSVVEDFLSNFSF